MSRVGQIERATQDRVVALLRDRLGWTYLGDRRDRSGNANVEEAELLGFLVEVQGYDPELAGRAVANLVKVAGDQSRPLYDVNREVYGLPRYGIKVRPGQGESTLDVWPIDWAEPARNRFSFAEEVTVSGGHTKRPDVVLYVNGIALGIIELKRSTVSLSEGIRQHLDNQEPMFIERFFTTAAILLAGNDTEGARYGTTGTRERYWLEWKEEGGGIAGDRPDLTGLNRLDRDLSLLLRPARFLELIHDFTVFDGGTKKLARHNQFFGIQAAREFAVRREGGIVWHTQGSGKSLTMVWLARWIRENVPDSRVLIVTDREELDSQIERNFKGVGESIHRTKSGAGLARVLNQATPALVCSLVHKFGGREDDAAEEFQAALKVPEGFRPKGEIFVFVDECHRTQSGDLHAAMKAVLPNATFIGFTGTPLLKRDRATTLETFGPYIHTYRYDEAVRDGVVLDLLYEARDVDQRLGSPEKIDAWFDAKTKGLNDVARSQLKERWGTMRKVVSSKSRLEKIVTDILFDMDTKPRLMDGGGNAMLVSDSVYNACRYYELFEKTELKGRCAIVTSYRGDAADVKGEGSGEGETERLLKHEVYRRMVGDRDPDDFEAAAKERFIEEPGQMRLLIVVDKLLTGFDAPSATYLYIDKAMRDHGLFQAICRVNRLDGEDKSYGYVVDYQDLFKSLETSLKDYTGGALDGYAKEDVAGLLADRVGKARERLEGALESVRALCEPVEPPRGSDAFRAFFCSSELGDESELTENEPRRILLYRLAAELLRAYASLATEMPQAGYSDAEAEAIRGEVDRWEKVRTEVRLASGDYIDLKMYEPAMRTLIDTYIRAEDSEKVSAFEEVPLVELLVSGGLDAAREALPAGIAGSDRAVAETIVNNVRKVIVDERASNPKYFDAMSGILEALVAERREKAMDYAAYLARVAELAARIAKGEGKRDYPTMLKTGAARALFDNLDEAEPKEARAERAAAIDRAIRESRESDWRGNLIRERRVRKAIAGYVEDEHELMRVFEVAKAQGEY